MKLLGGNGMSPLQITLIIILVIILVTVGIIYFVQKKYYRQIDELDAQKNDVLKNAPYDALKEVAELNITGQSQEVRTALENQWRTIETVKYPKLENDLYDAEQATDRYRLGESKKNQESAAQAITEIKEDISQLTHSLNDLIEREQANLKQIDEMKKRYHEVRKSLLAYSFSFGPASESFEKKLRVMENDFGEFSDLTVSGDHEEAKEVVQGLSNDILEIENQMERIPPMIEKLEDVHGEELKDLQNGYNEMIEAGYTFPDDSIEEDINQLSLFKATIYDRIRDLELDKAREETSTLSEEIEELYEKMEVEYQAKPYVEETLEDIRRAIYFLQGEQRRVMALANRMAQSYILNHDEEKKLRTLADEVKEAREEYDVIADRVKHQAIPYSVAYEKLDKLFDLLEGYNKTYDTIENQLESYRKEERELKADMLEMEQDMYAMKRYLENERLPGLPDAYLEMFFSTSTRIELLSKEMARPRIQLAEVRKIHQMCEEDLDQLSEMTQEIIRQVELTELVSQKLYRYKDSHKGVLETIRYSESLFTEDYDYGRALSLVREKLENVAPGTYKEIEEKYDQEKGFE